MDITELVRLLRAGESVRTITRLLGHNRRTIAKYRAWAEEQGLLGGPVLKVAEVERRLAETRPGQAPLQQTSSVAAWAEEIAGMRARGMEVAAIRGRLEERHRVPVSYLAVWRLVRKLEPKVPEAFVRVEVPPGSEGQVDFGYAGLTLDPATRKPRKTWVFVLVLSWSRHEYAELVFDQRVETWLLCHRHAFEFFGGVPARITPDNLKAAILRASFTDPVVQRAYRECAEHYGFRIDPNPPGSPHLKGKVEQGGVHYVKRNFLAGREPQPIDELNRALRTWCLETAGRRIHGTTKQPPVRRFVEVEREALLPLPATPYDLAVWQQATVYRDCYLTFQNAYYSAPFRLVGQQLWVRGGARTVELYTPEHELIATHDRATAPGERKTILAHLPPEKVPGLVLTRETCRLQAEAVGPATTELVQRYLDHRPVDRLRVAGRLVRLAQTYTPERLERACARALRFGDDSYPTVKRILAQGLDAEPTPTLPLPSPTPGRVYTFARQAAEFVASLAAGVW